MHPGLGKETLNIRRRYAVRCYYPAAVDREQMTACFGDERGSRTDRWGDHLYRYVLHIPFKNATMRSEPHRIVPIVMTNPSCCTPDKCDQTTKRALRYVLRHSEELGGADKVITVNLYAYHQTDSRALAHLLNEGAPSAQIVGPHNDHYIKYAAERSSIVIAAWGEPRGLRKEGHKRYSGRIREVSQLLSGRTVYCAGMRKDGLPRHFLTADLSSDSGYPIQYTVPD